MTTLHSLPEAFKPRCLPSQSESQVYRDSPRILRGVVETFRMQGLRAIIEMRSTTLPRYRQVLCRRHKRCQARS